MLNYRGTGGFYVTNYGIGIKVGNEKRMGKFAARQMIRFLEKEGFTCSSLLICHMIENKHIFPEWSDHEMVFRIRINLPKKKIEELLAKYINETNSEWDKNKKS